MNYEQTPGFMSQLAQAYHAAFLSNNNAWITPSVVFFGLAMGISAAFLHEKVLEPRYVSHYYAKHGAYPDQKTMIWYRAGNIGALIVVCAVYALAMNWPA